MLIRLPNPRTSSTYSIKKKSVYTHRYTITLYSRAERFKKKYGHMSFCRRLLSDPKSKIVLSSVAFSVSLGAQGPRKFCL